MKSENQLVGAPVESHVLLQCIVEAFPKPLNGWYRDEGLFFVLLDGFLIEGWSVIFDPSDQYFERCFEII